MKRILFFLLLVICGVTAEAQLFNNEWIDHSKTYYKFKVGKTGLYRIAQSALVNAGISVGNAQHFQLWRNGTQVPIYTSVSSGNFSNTDYIEFWGVMNDGKPDKDLYRDPAYQLNDKWSLETDTASYFLTINPSGSNFRLSPTPNNIAGNTLSPEPYFIHSIGNYFRERINSGFALQVDNSLLLSSSYDIGEGWSSNDIGSNGRRTDTLRNLHVYSSGPQPRFNIAVSGNSVNPRNYLVKINGDSVIGAAVDYFNDAKGSAPFSAALLAGDTALVQIINSVDRMVIHKYELTYARKFHFGGASNFEFTLPASNNGNYLEISNFSFGTTPPVLYDLTDGKQYVADVSAAPLIKLVLPPSANERKFVLVREEAANIMSVSEFQTRNFNNYALANNQGDYLIISNELLTNGENGTNPVEDYRAFRGSASGGAYQSKVYFVNELIDQFGFGINLNPIGIRNFLRFARRNFSNAPKHVFLLGKGVEYTTQRYFDNASVRRLNLVPVFGYPGSDVLMSAEGGSSIPLTPIGRLSVVHPKEISDYLAKVKQHELAQATLSPNFEDRGWMKNVAHLIGADEPALKAQLERYMNSQKTIISDTLYGANVSTFLSASSSTVSQLTNADFKKLMETGLSMITYFGHSSANVLTYNLDEPQNYNNTGKYPLFIALGCSAGNFFGADNARLAKVDGLSEKYVLAPQKGMIGFIASTHFGIVYYLNVWNEQMYNSVGNTEYGKTVGEAIRAAANKMFNYTTQEDFYSRANVEELGYHGDPAIRVNPHAKPDYLVTDPLVKITPAFISVAERSFKVDAQFYNIGKAVSNKISIEVKRQFPDGSTKIIYKDTISGIRYTHSISVDVPIDPNVDKGTNKIIITVDADNNVDEFYETNNSVTKEFLIYEDEARPTYPYNFAIINNANSKLTFSTANPFSDSKQYKIELDTTELFNSSFKISKIITSKGGSVDVDPGVSFTNNTVYYWRVAIVPASGEFKWNSSSFVYLQNHEPGFAQGHLYQHLKSQVTSIYLDSASRQWKHPKSGGASLIVRIGTFPFVGSGQQSVTLNGNQFTRSGCWARSLIFNVIDAASNQPWLNQTSVGVSFPSNTGVSLYESVGNNCASGRVNNFEYPYTDSAGRRKIMNFMANVIPDGAYVVVRSNDVDDSFGLPKVYASDWAADTSYYGNNKSVYHYLKNAGFSDIDSFYKGRQWAFIYKKNDPSFTPQWVMTQHHYDINLLAVAIEGTETKGLITSPKFGPAKKWKQLSWEGTTLEAPSGDKPLIDLIGIKYDNTETTLFSNIGLTQKSVDISAIDTRQFPFLKLQMRNTDTINFTPYQLSYWRLTSDPAPEGAVAPNIYFKMSDTLELGQPIDFKLAFKNISPYSFDSLKIKMVVTDKNNVQHVIPVIKHRPLAANDTIHVRYNIDTRSFTGLNTLYVEVNPDNDQPEQYQFNNFIFSKFQVGGDNLNPVMDVTFDNVHILNNDIVSSNPEIIIKLKDESQFLLLKDTSLVTVKVRFPDNKMRTFSFNSDTLTFTAAQSTSDNTATINFKPNFTLDGNYELIVSGKDQSDNIAGGLEYKVGFQVINKPMISNLLNYPNPFTTSTAFVFTLTGREVPQNIKIQILTVTGKIVREINKQELGPLRIGRNITEFKWDGTDQYGQKLGNGIYLYRVVTNLNGKSLDKYKAEKDDTDKYFNKGYGKMYLMR